MGISIRFLRRIPFTLAMLTGLMIIALLTETHNDVLSAAWLARLGFASNDLWELRIERLFTSALITFGGNVFWEAFGMVAIAVGLAELLTSTHRTLLTFWGVHLFVLVIESLLIAIIFRFWGNPDVEAISLARDVGPSAGYFACLGLVCASLPSPYRQVGFGLILSGLVIALFLPAKVGESEMVKLLADLAHLLAFPSGWLSKKIPDLKILKT